KVIEGNTYSKGMRRVPTRIWGESGGASRFFYCAKASRRERGEGNDHPTVKPLALMRWLIRLVTAPDTVVLDPFCGSGSTLLAARAEGREAVGIDSDPHSIDITIGRLEKAMAGQLPFAAAPVEHCNV
ncbi:MAG TPA: site-specific DNA-methyltransferase, partial [Phycisphaerae bacterium]|nr:site-specific DNA-methyltransferase [Phycisphaerae bacterium]